MNKNITSSQGHQVSVTLGVDTDAQITFLLVEVHLDARIHDLKFQYCGANQTEMAQEGFENFDQKMADKAVNFFTEFA